MHKRKRPECMSLMFSNALEACIDLVIEDQVNGTVSRQQSRRVLGKLINQCHNLKQEDATQLVMPHARYSLTHCLNTVAAVANRLRHAMGTGIDLEYGRSMSSSAAKFFLTHKEQLNVNSSDNVSRQLLRLWTVKEAIYKADLDNRCNFWFLLMRHKTPRHGWGLQRKWASKTKNIFVTRLCHTGMDS